MKIFLNYFFYFLFFICLIIILSSIFSIITIFNLLIKFPKEYLMVVLFIFSLMYIFAFIYIINLKDKIEQKEKEVERHRVFIKEVETSINSIINQLTNLYSIDISNTKNLFLYENIQDDNIRIKRIKEVAPIVIRLVKSLEQCIIKKDELYNLLQKQNNLSITKITSLYSDFLTLQYDLSEKYLKNKDRPALVEAKRIAELRRETKVYIEKYNIMKYKYEELLNVFPELKDYADDFESLKELENIKNINQLQDEYDRVRDYISKEEYHKLNETQRNQLALDRYIKGDKTNWQIGRDYELYIGHWLRKQGYKVWQYGVEKKLKDLGCDIIAVSNEDNKVYIIQCKRWKADREINEKYILYLYGTYILLKKNYKEILNIGLFNETVLCNFISTHQVTDTAKEIAKTLNVGLSIIQFQEFPRIKCNINNDNKIYHLPFDQQYDRTQIKNPDEFYAMTVKDAEDKGFRRAYKYHF